MVSWYELKSSWWAYDGVHNWVGGWIGYWKCWPCFHSWLINKEVWNMPVNRIAIVRHNMVWTQLFSLFFFIKELSIKYVRKIFQLTVLMYKEARNYILSKSFACPLNGWSLINNTARVTFLLLYSQLLLTSSVKLSRK